MAINMEFLGPQAGEEEDFAIETLVFSVQVALQRAMSRRGVTNKALAEKLGMSPARVSQIFASKGPNLTVKTIARIAHALGEDFELVSKHDIKKSLPSKKAKGFMPVIIDGGSHSVGVWEERVANSSKLRPKVAA